MLQLMKVSKAYEKITFVIGKQFNLPTSEKVLKLLMNAMKQKHFTKPMFEINHYELQDIHRRCKLLSGYNKPTILHVSRKQRFNVKKYVLRLLIIH